MSRPATATLSAEQLVEIKARADAATEGIWLYNSVDREIFVSVAGAPRIAVLKNDCTDSDDTLLANGMFVANARIDVPALLATVREQAANISELQHYRVALEYAF